MNSYRATPLLPLPVVLDDEECEDPYKLEVNYRPLPTSVTLGNHSVIIRYFGNDLEYGHGNVR